jgi:hypothetical protein
MIKCLKPAAMRIRIARDERRRIYDVSILIVDDWWAGQVLGWQSGAQRSSLPPYRDVLSFRSEAPIQDLLACRDSVPRQ